MPETHEVKLFDAKRCCEEFNELDLAYQVQAGQAVTAGYFGGYAAKMQSVGTKELQAMERSLQRKLEVAPAMPETKSFHEYSRRLVRDLEGKGVIRTSVETVNLSLHADSKDILDAECVRTFPSIHFPATLLLKREEIETLKVAGVSIIACMHRAGPFNNRAYVDAPFDLLYGLQGSGPD